MKVSRRRGFTATLAIVALALAGCASTESLQSEEVQRLRARAAYERGTAELAKREVSAALSAFREAISLDPSVSLYRASLGRLFLQIGRPDLAVPEFSAAVELEPTYADAHLLLGTARAEMGLWKEAVEDYRKAIASPLLTTPDVAYQNLGLALYHLKQYRDAEAALRFAISLEPDKAGPYYNLGLVYLAEDRRKEARAAWQRVRQLAPKSPFGRAAAERLQALGEGGQAPLHHNR